MKRSHVLALSAALLALAACGGDDSAPPIGGAPAPSQPSPTPTPTPSPSAAPTSVGLGAQGAYVTLGYATTLTVNPDNGSPPTQDFTVDDSTPIGFRFLGEGRGYEIAVPGLDPRALACSPSAHGFTHCTFGTEPISDRGLGAYLLRPNSSEVLPLAHTSLVSYNTADGPPVIRPTISYHGLFAYGVQTQPSRIPPSGNFEVRSVLRGGPAFFEPVTLRIDFAARTLSGQFDLIVRPDGEPSYKVGTFTLDAEIDANSGIAGVVNASNIVSPGRIEGLLTGPNAEELMLRLRFEYQYPQNGAVVDFFGVLAGRVAAG